MRSTLDSFFRVLLGLPFLWLFVLFLVPLSFVFLYSFSEVEGIIGLELTWTTQHYLKVFESVYLKIFFKSITIATITTIICLFFGFQIALFIATTSSSRLQYFYLLLVILPFWTNLLIRTYALIAVLRGNGYLNKFLGFLWDHLNAVVTFFSPQQKFILPYENLELLYNNFAVVFGLVYVHLPFMVLPLYAALAKMDKSIIEASFDLGATKSKTLSRVIIPVSAEGIFAGILITFIPVLGSFLTPDLLGGNDSQMIANLIERQFKGANNWPFGAALSSMLMYILFFVFAFKSLLNRK